MADFRIALESTLRKEDAKLEGKITTDTGGRTRFGISEHANPSAFPAILECDCQTAMAMAGDIYRAKYWKFDGVESQLVANKIFDFAVNMGVSTAVRFVQKIGGIPMDGAWGPITCAAINRIAPMQALQSLRDAAVKHYYDIVKSNPDKYERFLEGWLARARS